MTLKELSKALSDQKHSTVPEHCRPVKSYRDNSANELTKSVLAYFEFKGWKAWRQASEGRFIQGRNYKDWAGREKQEKGMYIPRSKAAKGIGDIACIMKGGRFLSVEIKFGKDRMRDEQKKFKEEAEEAGAVYMVVKTWEDFIFQINKFQ